MKWTSDLWTNKLRWYPQQPQRFIFTNIIWSVLRSQALETPQPASKASQTFSGTFSRTLLNLTCLCTKPPGTFSGTFSRTLLKLTWPFTNSRLPGTFSGTSSATLLNLTCLAPKSPRPSPEPSPEPCWTWPASAQSLPDLLQNLLRNPAEPDLALHQSLPGLLKNLLQNPLNLTWICSKASWNLLREPSPEPCWTWPGSAPKPPSFSGTCSGTFSGTPLNLTCLCTKDLLRNLWNLLRNPRWIWPGACTNAHRSYSGLKTPLAYAVGEQKWVGPPLLETSPVKC